MSMHSACPHCRVHLRVDRASSKGTIKCPACGSVFVPHPFGIPVAVAPTPVTMHPEPYPVSAPPRSPNRRFRQRNAVAVVCFVVALLFLVCFVVAINRSPSGSTTPSVPFVFVKDLCLHPEDYTGQYIETNLLMANFDKLGIRLPEGSFPMGVFADGSFYIVGCTFVPSHRPIALSFREGTFVVVRGYVDRRSIGPNGRDAFALMTDCIVVGTRKEQ